MIAYVPVSCNDPVQEVTVCTRLLVQTDVLVCTPCGVPLPTVVVTLQPEFMAPLSKGCASGSALLWL